MSMSMWMNCSSRTRPWEHHDAATDTYKPGLSGRTSSLVEGKLVLIAVDVDIGDVDKIALARVLVAG
eukprot:3424672-Amphidinium_carterae.1